MYMRFSQLSLSVFFIVKNNYLIVYYLNDIHIHGHYNEILKIKNKNILETI